MQLNKLLIQKISLLMSDGLALIVSLLLASILLEFTYPGSHEVHFAIFGFAKLIGVLLLVVFWYQEQYLKRRPTWEELRLLFRTIVAFAILHLVVSYLASHHVVKMLNIYFWLFVLVTLPSFRLITKYILTQLSLWQRDVYIVGTGEVALATYKLLKGNSRLGYNVIGFVNLTDNIQGELDPKINSQTVFEYDDLINFSSRDAEIIFAVPAAELLKHTDKIDILQSKYLFVSIVPDIGGLPLYGVSVEHFFGSDQLFLRLQNNLGRKFNRYIKRVMDVMISSVLLITLSPIFFIIAILIKFTSRGTVFYKHQRVGMSNHKFNCLKFRTMYKDSQQHLERLLASNKVAQEEWNATHKLKNDPRVTAIGRVLRKSSLDELPQLVNVLMGEMSLVGPRPIVEDEIKRYSDQIYYYNLVRPGVTGLWQISGRSDTDYKRRVQFDVWYVKNWSLWYDWVILFKTIPALLMRSGAY